MCTFQLNLYLLNRGYRQSGIVRLLGVKIKLIYLKQISPSTFNVLLKKIEYHRLRMHLVSTIHHIFYSDKK